MRFADPLKKIFAILTIALMSMPLPALAQDEKKEPEKKDEKKDEKKPETPPLPLKAEKTIKFSTNEGTWMSLDVSPDGKQITFDLLGDIYTMPIEGGDAKKIHGGMSFESQPKFSPDGKHIVFLSDRSGSENVWLMKADGSDAKAVTTGPKAMYVSPNWTEDGNYIIVSKSDQSIGTFYPFMYHKDGGSGVSIGAPAPPLPGPGTPGPAAPRMNHMGLVASPDGRFIYFAQRSGAFNYNAQFPMWQILRFDRETSETSRITNAQGSAMRPVISPDGKSMVYATRYGTKTALRVRDLLTSQERWLINNVTRDDQESRATRDTFPGYDFMPDGRSLIVPINGKIARVDFASGQATNIPFNVNVEMEVAPKAYFKYRVPDDANVEARLIRYPTVSPDGKRVAFTAFSKLYVMDLPSGTPKKLTNNGDGEFMPAWSPDGKTIAYVTWTGSKGGNIYSVSANGGASRQLTNSPAYYANPTYSPDGSKIVFVTGAVDDQLYADIREDHQYSSPEEEILHKGDVPGREVTGSASSTGTDLKYIPAGGGAAVHISAAQGRLPHFSDDPNRVYMTSGQGLVSIRLDGHDRRVHARITGKGTPPQQPAAGTVRISPDRSRAFLDLQGKHYLVTLPRSGRETTNISLAGPTANVPFKKMSVYGGDYLEYSPDGKYVSWSWGTKLFRQAVTEDKPQEYDIKVTMPRHRPSGSVVLTNARVVTMKGAEVIEKGDVVVTDNRIDAIGPAGKVTRPAGAKIVDVAGKTIIPGFVDVHAHMWPPRDLHQPQVWQYLANLAYGVTTTRDPQSATTDVYNYADLVETGSILGPRVLTTGPGVFSGLSLDDKDTAFNYIKRYRDAYKTDTLKQYVVGDRNVRQWVAMASSEYKITPTTEGALDMKLDLSQMIDGYTGHEHSLPLQPIYNDVIQFMAQHKVYYTPTILVAYGSPWVENHWFQNSDVLKNQKLARYIPAELVNGMMRRRPQWFAPEEYNTGNGSIAKGVADIVKAGGRAGIGGHGQMQGIGVHWEIWNVQAGGLSNHDTLRVATVFGAEAIGMDQDLGSLESGKLADLIILDKNPLDDIKNTNTIRYVMKNGELFEGDTLNQVWPKQKPLDSQYWWNMGPKENLP